MGGFLADVNSIINMVIGLLGNVTGLTSVSAAMAGIGKQIMSAIRFAQFVAMVAAAFTALGALAKLGFSSVLGGIGCLVEEVFLRWPERIFHNIFLRTVTWLFVDAFRFPTPCLFYWLAYMFCIVLYHVLDLLLSVIYLDMMMDMMYGFMVDIDTLDLTGDILYLTRFPNSVRDLCFSTPNMKWWLYWEFSHCGMGIPDFGLPDAQGVLRMWSDPPGDLAVSAPGDIP